MTEKKIKNIYLYFGEDDFTIAEEIKKAKESFEKEFKNAEISEIDWNDGNLNEQEKMARLQNGLMANSLFGIDKLLIIKNTLFSKKSESAYELKPELRNSEFQSSDGKEKIVLKYLENPRENIKVFFVENNLDKRKKIYKEIVKLEKFKRAEVKEFLTPANFQFDNWIKETVKKSGGKIEREAVNALAISLGKGLQQKDKNKKIVQSYNLWEAKSEIEKLVSYCDDKEITKEVVGLLVKSKVDMNIFSLIDSIGSKNKRKAVNLLNEQIDEGANEIYMLTMFVYQFRNLLKIKSLLDKGMSSYEIASETKMHPFVVQKSIEQCGKFEMSNLKKIYKKLSDADLAIKTGKINSRLVLDLLVVSV
ncbi:MAG: DNA polymerase III subunit delta [Patescibacteria group bacterium]|nr:DNA polymerase III subunit delta [Patescibacteria group bacterium]